MIAEFLFIFLLIQCFFFFQNRCAVQCRMYTKPVRQMVAGSITYEKATLKTMKLAPSQMRFYYLLGILSNCTLKWEDFLDKNIWLTSAVLM